MRILNVEPDLSVAQSLSLIFEAEGHRCHHDDGIEPDETVQTVRLYEFDVVVAEPGNLNAGSIVRRLRTARVSTPVVVLTHHAATVEDRLRHFEDGADDVLQKPFHRDELLARVGAVVRRSKGHAAPLIEVGSLVLDCMRKSAGVDGRRVHLTGKEFSLLELLVLRRGSVLTKDAILDQLYGGRDEPELKIIDVFICKLRKKLAEAGGSGIIQTVWGRGYMVDAPLQQRAAA